jgi:DNA (cytosine-5)-methyltransferase 1
MANPNGNTRLKGRQDYAEEGPGGGHPDRGDLFAEMADSECERQSPTGNSEKHDATHRTGEADQPRSCGENAAHANGERLEGSGSSIGIRPEIPGSGSAGWWESEPDVGRVAHGVAHRVDRLTAIGNGQVSRVAKTAWRLLQRRIKR